MSYSIMTVTPPTVEPVSVALLKAALGLSSGSYKDNVTITQSIAPGSQSIAASYSLTGVAVDTLGSQVLIIWEWAGFGQGATVDVKVQGNQDNGATWTDVPAGDLEGGLFAQVTTATANATFERGYLGGKRYLRVVSTVAGAAGSFGVSIHANAGQSADDTLLASLETEVRQAAEDFDGRRFIDTRLVIWYDDFPDEDYFALPVAPLLATPAVVIHYYDVDDVEATVTATDYYTDAPEANTTDPWARHIYLADGHSWPTTTLRPFRGVRVEVAIGYGTTAASVPEKIRGNIRNATCYAYLHRGDPEAVKDYLERVCSWPDRMGIV